MISLFRVGAVFFALSVSSYVLGDIGLRHTEKSTSKVIYGVGDQVYLKKCGQMVARPTRACESSESPISVERSKYLRVVSKETGSYEISSTGLNLAESDLEVAEAAASKGSAEAKREAERLRSVVKNLKEVLTLDANLEPEKEVQFSQFDEQYETLLKGFGYFAIAQFFDVLTSRTYSLLAGRFTQLEAAKACAQLGDGGYFLPKIDDLTIEHLPAMIKENFAPLSTKIRLITGAEGYSYWSSSYRKPERRSQCGGGNCGYTLRIRSNKTGTLFCWSENFLPFCPHHLAKPFHENDVICAKEQ